MESPSVVDLRTCGKEDMAESYLAGQKPEGPSISVAHAGCITPEWDGKPLFESGDGDIKLWVNGVCFETHKYLIKRFSYLKDLLYKQSTDAALSVQRDEHGVGDFHNMFRVLYASILEGPFEFDSQTLVSALRISTAYGYPALRAYSINHLEQIELPAVERIKIAREFQLGSWEEPAFVELCGRDDAITMKEAGILGLETFVRVAEIREKEQRRRGKEVDGRTLEQGVGSGSTSGDGGSSKSGEAHSTPDSGNATANAHQSAEETSSSSACSETPHTDSGEADGTGTRADGSGQTSGIAMKPSFINSKLDHAHAWDDWHKFPGYRLKVTGCNCRVLNKDGSTHEEGWCTITPCAAAAFKDLQVQQLAHSNAISTLELSVNKLATSFTAVPKPAVHPKPNHSWIRKEVRKMLDALQESRAVA